MELFNLNNQNHLKYIFFIIFLLPVASYAQKETNIWYFGKHAGLDFSSDPPKVLLDGALESHEGSAVMADQDGNLLFYTNGETIWNRNHQVMDNGNDLGGHQSARQSSVIIPAPASDGSFFIFTVDADENQMKNGLRYSIVDLKENGGLGKVLEKGIQLHAPATEGLSVVGSCIDGEDRDYWVIAASKDKPGKVYAYKVDSSGVSKEPVISSVPLSTTLNYIKASPSGNKAVLVGQEHNGEKDPEVIITDFDFSSGTFYKPYNISVKKTTYFNQVEFSPNGKLLYVSSGREVLQINLADYQVVDAVDSGSEMQGEFQLAPDGRIYIVSFTSDTKLSVIRKPNEKGFQGNFQKDAIDVQRPLNLGLPNFERSLFYNGLNPDAGKDSLICSGQELVLGTKPEDDTFYQWYPTEHLNTAGIANPVFQYQNTSDTIQTFEYVVTAYNEVCAKKDTIQVQVFPTPPAQITGSQSVCPGVVGVVYQVAEKEGYQYHWEVEGGEISAGQGSGTILVDWGPTNAEAIVHLVIISESTCVSSELEFPVRINVELETETPQGPETVCANQRKNVSYSLTNTNGSIYTWNVKGGTITGGQGSHQVWVDWEGAGKHSLWVQEQSKTVDTVCFGISEVLDVLVFEDTTEIALDYVSISLKDDQISEIRGNHEKGAVVSANLTLLRRQWGTETWEAVGETTKDSIYFNDGLIHADEVSYEYIISSRNPCDQEISSLPHRTILLTGNAKEEKDEVVLTWSPYTGWPNGVARYEVWRKIDEEKNYQLVGSVDGHSHQFISTSGADGFKHYFRIKAIESSSGNKSWSNEINLDFHHELTIPNVFTPNGDNFNETFRVIKLEMYPENELTIYNRWGEIVFRKRGYQGEWNGAGSPAGVYFYSLKLERTKKHFKGWVQVVRQEEEPWEGK